jgi:phage baseplate assembly protein W
MTITKKDKLYSDIDLRFTPQPATKDVSLSYDEQAVIRSIRNLLLTKPFERLFQPTLSSRIDNLLFEPITSLTANLVKDEIIRVISNWEPRATIASLDVTSYPDQNGYQVSLFVYIGNRTQPTAVNLLLKRSR